MRAARWCVVGALVVLAGAGLTGCGSGSDPATITTTSDRDAGEAGEWFSGADLDLAQAVESDSADQIATLVAAGADVQATGTDGMTMLQFAVRQERSDATAALLAAGADPNRTGYRGGTALESAVEQPDLVTVLLKAGADPDVPNAVTGMTVLAQSCLAATPGSFDLLLQAGADVTIANNNGDSALHTCARTNQGAEVLRLLERGADPEARTSTGATFQDYYFAFNPEVLNPQAVNERRQIVRWLLVNGHPLVPAAEQFR